MKRAVITGIGGQDGSYLAELLLEKGYKVFGLVRRSSSPESEAARVKGLVGNGVELEYGDMTDSKSLRELIVSADPHEVYNLAGQSQVWVSYRVPEFTFETNAAGVMKLLDICRWHNPNIRFYQASSSEMFGNAIDSDGFQRENTPKNPTSPYGCSKVFAYNMVRHYRNAYKMFAVNGILFNHASPRRGSQFIDSKIVKTALLIKSGAENKIIMGNLDSYRDWGHAKDYVRAMHKIVNHTEPDDFVISSMETHSVREFAELSFSKLGLDFYNHVEIDKKLLRDEELVRLRGDSTKARTVLEWQPEYDFDALLDDMIAGWSAKINNEQGVFSI